MLGARSDPDLPNPQALLACFLLGNRFPLSTYWRRGEIVHGLGTWTMKFHAGSRLTQPGRTGRPANDLEIQCWFPVLPCTNNSRQRTFPKTCWKGVWGGWLRLCWFFIPRYLQLYNLWFTFLACCGASPVGLTSPERSGTPVGSQLHGP